MSKFREYQYAHRDYEDAVKWFDRIDLLPSGVVKACRIGLCEPDRAELWAVAPEGRCIDDAQMPRELSLVILADLDFRQFVAAGLAALKARRDAALLACREEVDAMQVEIRATAERLAAK